MASSSRGFTTQLDFRLRRPVDISRGQVNGLDEPRKRKRVSFEGERIGVSRISCCCSDPVVPIRSCKSVEKCEEWRFDPKKSSHRSRIQASPSMPFASSQSCSVSKQGKFYPRCTPRNSGPQSRDSPPKRDTGIANEKDWGISLLNENVNETGTNEDGSTWYRESGEDLGENGYRCRWTRMGGRSHDDSSEWKETWWEKSDWTGYKELGVEKSGRNAEGDSWWETWQEVLHQDEWSNLARIERSAQKQAKSGTENAGWYEKWWEKYDAKGWTEKGAHKTDKWAETELGTKWGDKWEEKFFAGIGSRQGETWHVSPSGELVCFVNHPHKVIVIFVHRAEPHYGWADVVGDSSQLLSIQPRDRPPGVFPNLDFGPSPDPADDQPG
ncbi:Inactive purple acid phosphatase-like protein [Citrus sinensis]|nr:Inactive purple acid phosphatase-like protein [Citrus sinensis]